LYYGKLQFLVYLQVSTAAFMFTSINQKLEEYLPPAILELQRNEIRQCVFYNAIQVSQEVIDEFGEVCIYIVYLLCLHFI